MESIRGWLYLNVFLRERTTKTENLTMSQNTYIYIYIKNPKIKDLKQKKHGDMVPLHSCFKGVMLSIVFVVAVGR